MMTEFNFLQEIEEELDKQFPKGECKERGNALVLYAMVNLKFREFIKDIEEDIGYFKKKYGEESQEDWDKLIKRIKKRAGKELI